MSMDYKEGEYALSLGAYAQAFETFFDIEKDQQEPTFIKCCQMVLANQVAESEITDLKEHLEREMRRNNVRATYNYGLIMAHLGHPAKAQEILNQAVLLGLPEAKSALTKLLLTGSCR
ncbi:MAG: hypothetical protein FGM18_05660 [Burkholderiaceae bacterium]|nr:hypothetical protein [Burkholderiaceae bacterium]